MSEEKSGRFPKKKKAELERGPTGKGKGEESSFFHKCGSAS